MSGKSLLAAAVVMVIAVTPTILDAWDTWIKRPEHRWVIVAVYIVAAIVALSAADMLVNT